jgi:hypothetical protein
LGATRVGRIAGWVLTGMVPLIAGSCGGADDSRVAVPDAAQAVAATMESTVRFQSVSESSMPMGMIARTTIDGQVDFDRDASYAVITSTLDGGEAHSQLATEQTTAEFVVVDGTAYLNDGGQGWRSMPIPQELAGLDLFVPDIARELEQLESVQDGELLGTHVVRGARAEGYQFDALDGHGTVEMWIDEAGRVVRMRTEPEPTPPLTLPDVVDPGSRTLVGDTQLVEAPQTYEFWAFGEPVDIAAPTGAIPCDLAGDDC